MTHAIFEKDGITLHYRHGGSGLPLLLLHGFGEDSRIFDHCLPTLQQVATCIVPDLPGSGRSPCPWVAGHAQRLENMSQLLWQLLDELGIEKAVVLGHSMGGYIALCMHQQASGRMLGWGLLHSTAFADSEEKKATRRKAIQFIQQHGAQAFLQTAIPGLFAPAFAEANAAVVQQLMADGAGFSPAALIDYYEAMIARPDRTAELQRSQVPVLFVLGELDKAAPYADLLQQVAMPDHAHITVLRHVAHMGMLEQPAAFEAALVQFLQSLV